MPHLARALVLLGAAVAGACISTTAYDPMVAGPAPVQRIKTIAVTSTALPKGVSSDAAIQQQFDRALVDALQSAGYRVIQPADVDPVWHSLSDTAQLYDGKTGTLNTDQESAILRAMSREVKTRFNADAWLFADFTKRNAHYSSGWCEWDGTKQRVQTTGSVLKNAFLGVTSSSGTMPALSVRVVITDTAGRAIYRNYGGIAALVKVAAGGTQDLVTADAFTDDERNAKAVQLALKPLVDSGRQDRQR